MHGLLSGTLLCKATLRFKNRTWYDDHENSVAHSTVMVSTGVEKSHNKGKWRVTTIKQIYLTNSGCLPYVPHIETAYASQSALIARASTGPWDATPPAGSEWCLHLYAIGCNFSFQLGLQMTSNILEVRGLGRPGKHSGHIYWVMLAVT